MNREDVEGLRRAVKEGVRDGLKQSDQSLLDQFIGQAMHGMAAAPDNWNHNDIPNMACDLAEETMRVRDWRMAERARRIEKEGD